MARKTPPRSSQPIFETALTPAGIALVCDAVRAEAHRLGLTSREIAAKCDKTEQQVGRWLNGVVKPGAANVGALAKAVGLTIEQAAVKAKTPKGRLSADEWRTLAQEGDTPRRHRFGADRQPVNRATGPRKRRTAGE